MVQFVKDHTPIENIVEMKGKKKSRSSRAGLALFRAIRVMSGFFVILGYAIAGQKLR